MVRSMEKAEISTHSLPYILLSRPALRPPLSPSSRESGKVKYYSHLKIVELENRYFSSRHPPYVKFENSWQMEEVPEDYKVASVTHILKNKKEILGNDTPLILTSVSGKTTEQILLSAMSWCRKDQFTVKKTTVCICYGQIHMGSIIVTVSCGEMTRSKQELLSPGVRVVIV